VRCFCFINPNRCLVRKQFIRFGCVALAAFGGALAQTGTPIAVAANVSTTPEPTQAAPDASVGVYLDGLVAGLMKREHLAGITVAMTRRDAPILLRGYGMANAGSTPGATAQPARPVDPELSLFRVGSTSKLVTYLAAMQLVEQGTLDLEAPINTILPDALKVPAQGYAEPIRVKHLLTHSAGFEDLALGHLFVLADKSADKAAAPSHVLALSDYLARYRPNRVRAPGTAAVYSNYSVALLGEIVALRSGELFEDYVENHVFKPLGMRHSSFREPHGADSRTIAPALAADMAQGFQRRGGVFAAQAVELIGQIAPAGGLSTTAADMARFGRMLLNDGELDGVRVIRAATLKQMREGCFRNGQVGAATDISVLGVQPICHGYMTRDYGPHRGFGHGGATVNFHTAFMTVPSLDLAVFVSINSDNGRASAGDIADFLIAYVSAPSSKSAGKVPPGATRAMLPLWAVTAAQTQAVTGDYLTNRRPFSGLTGLLQSLSGESMAPAGKQAPAGALVFTGGPEPVRLNPVAPLIYQNADTGSLMQFLSDEQGAITGYAGAAGHATSAKIGGWHSPIVWASLTGALFAIALITLISSYAGLGTQRRPALRAVKLMSALTACVVILMVTVFIALAGELDGSSALFSYPTANAKRLAVLMISSALLGGIKLLCLPLVLKSDWYRLAKFGYAVSTAVVITWAVSSYGWGLLSLNVTEMRGG
jgi:CubicO group peptidase (beta-lactamase class C family)